MNFRKFYASSDSLITYTPLLTSIASEIMYIQFHQRKTMKGKVLEKQKDSFKIKFDKNVMLKLKYICIYIFAVF